MAVLPLVAATVIIALVLRCFLNSKNIPDEDRQMATSHDNSNRRRRHHHGNKRRHDDRRSKFRCKDNPPVQQSSGFHQFLSALKQFFMYPISTMSFFSPWYERESNARHRHRSSWQSTPTSTSQNSMDDYFHDAIVVGLDCEMVGGGRGGWKSLLARCSVVTLDHVPRNDTSYCNEQTSESASSNQGSNRQERQEQQQTLNRLDENLIVLYDKYVVPKGKITDYRTEWSGITKDTYSAQSQSPIPIVSFNQCRNEITQLFSSIQGRRVIVVGHALENDFEALEIDHPPALMRDTAFFRPYMRESRRKMYPRKLSVLTKEELGIHIQQKSQGDPNSQISTIIGHSSVEDAAAALRLYWHKFTEWERYLGYPLTMAQQATSRCHLPLQMYLDGCNLPIGCRGVSFKTLLMDTTDSGNTGTENKMRTISSETLRLTSRKRENIHSPNVSTIDWIPAFQSALSPHSRPKFSNISVMFDGAKYGSSIGGGTRVFCVDSSIATDSENCGSIQIHITNNGDSADDVLVHVTRRTENSNISDTSDSKRIISLDKTVEILANTNDTETDVLPHYIVVRRKAGGTKTHRKLFDKLHLRRANEGAVCLAALTTSLKKHSLKIARELQREKSIDKVIECELRDRDELRFVVVTDDVYLTDRLVRGNKVLVLSFQQLLNLW